MRLFVASLIAAAAFALNPAIAADDPAIATAMVDKGASFLQKKGKEALITAVNAKDPQFITGEPGELILFMLLEAARQAPQIRLQRLKFSHARATQRAFVEMRVQSFACIVRQSVVSIKRQIKL